MSGDIGVLIPVAAILAWPLSIAARSLGRGSGAAASDLARLDARLARLEQAVDAVAVEMERVAEGQRFTAAVLTERAGTAPASPAVGAGGPRSSP